MASDPFAAFGHDDGDDENNDDTTEEKIDSELFPGADATRKKDLGRTHQRTHENGVLSFHNGTEHSLLLYVQQAMKSQPWSSAQEQQQQQRLRQTVLQAIDKFCFERHWMMHVGPDKGRIVQDFLTDQIIQQTRRRHVPERTFNVVELGTYCGYSAIRIADTLLQHNQIVPKFHIQTIDTNAQSQNIAKELIALAGLEQYVSFIVRQSTEEKNLQCVSFVHQLADSLLDKTKTATESTNMDVNKQIDFLFVDHAKEMYLSDVQELESCGFIRQGTAIAADNVVFFQLSDYCQYMSSLHSRGIVQTQHVTDNIFLEYAPGTAENDLRDGLELTVYLKDPI